jgi:hypothetical protein
MGGPTETSVTSKKERLYFSRDKCELQLLASAAGLFVSESSSADRSSNSFAALPLAVALDIYNNKTTLTMLASVVRKAARPMAVRTGKTCGCFRFVGIGVYARVPFAMAAFRCCGLVGTAVRRLRRTTDDVRTMRETIFCNLVYLLFESSACLRGCVYCIELNCHVV